MLRVQEVDAILADMEQNVFENLIVMGDFMMLPVLNHYANSRKQASSMLGGKAVLDMALLFIIRCLIGLIM